MVHYKRYQIIILAFLSLWLAGCVTTTNYSNYSQRPDVHEFINKMSEKHDFDREELCELFSNVKYEPQIFKTLEKPHEGKATPWYTYQAIFITPKRAKEGAEFWKANEKTLAKVEKEYGVPAEIIVAIIGVETRYGQNKGSYRVIDALTNLAFDYPRRAEYFRGELEEYLLLSREQNLNPLEPVGSYAGAIGEPQFMPSSYRLYGIDFSGEHHADLCNNNADVIASVANYFKKHGWKTGEPIVIRAHVTGSEYSHFITKRLKPIWSIEELSKHGVTAQKGVSPKTPVVFMLFEGKCGPEYWLGCKNFYAITRYNSSRYYAMAVYQLSQKIAQERGLH